MKSYNIIPIIAITAMSHLSLADETGKDHQHDKAHDSHHASILIPEDPASLWAAINAYGKVVSDAADKGDIETLHKQQNNLQSLINELDHTLGILPEDKRSRVQGMISNAKRALDQLHGVADGKDVEAMKKAVKALNGTILLMKAQYPAEITKGMAVVKDDIGPHEGILAAFKDSAGTAAGHLELKLHDDKGDLELWLAQDSGITKAFDLDLATTILVTFENAKEKSVVLKVRNSVKNEDEDGHSTLRNGKTNYFIFPGDSGASAKWLMGAKFKSKVVVSFKSGDTSYTTDSFLLVPHTHADHGHAH